MERSTSNFDHSSSEIGFSELKFDVKIGEGTFGEVWKGTCRGKEVAIKKLKNQNADDYALGEFRKEIDIMSKIRHPNIVLFLGVCITTNDLYLVSEYLPRGDLETLLGNSKYDASLFRRLRMAKDAALGMNWLHCSKPQFIHRDLKTSNLLVDENGGVKVCDFGLSQIRNQGERLRDNDFAKGTPLWMAPEVMQFQDFDEKCDIYSFGIVLWEILTRSHPYEHHQSFESFKEAVCVLNERPSIPKNIEISLSKLIQSCWHPNPSYRPSFDHITNEFDNVLVDVAVSDAIGRQFWKEKFLGKDYVPFKEFLPSFLKFLDLPPVHADFVEQSVNDEETLRLKCLKYLMVDKPGTRTDQTVEIVHLEKFGKILDYFGPIDDPSSGNGYLILERMSHLLKFPWFHGDITTEDAQEILGGKNGNTFLIRFSSIGGMYTLSRMTPARQILHQRIKRLQGGSYIIDGIEFETLEQFLTEKKLTEACPGSKYAHIFQSNPPNECGYITRGI